MSKRRPAHAVSIEASVAFHQCDPLGVAWHGRYFEWFEAARTALLASRDLDVPALRGLGLGMYVVEARCRYMLPLTYGDRIRVTAWFTARTPLVRVAYDVHRLDAERWCARGHTLLATTDARGTLITRPPADLLTRLPEV